MLKMNLLGSYQIHCPSSSKANKCVLACLLPTIVFQIEEIEVNLNPCLWWRITSTNCVMLHKNHMSQSHGILGKKEVYMCVCLCQNKRRNIHLCQRWQLKNDWITCIILLFESTSFTL